MMVFGSTILDLRAFLDRADNRHEPYQYSGSLRHRTTASDIGAGLSVFGTAVQTLNVLMI